MKHEKYVKSVVSIPQNTYSTYVAKFFFLAFYVKYTCNIKTICEFDNFHIFKKCTLTLGIFIS